MTHKSSKIVYKEFVVDGQKFWIQSVEKCHIETLMDVVINGYFREEPVALYTEAYNDSKYISNAKAAYEDLLTRCYNIVCLTLDERQKPVIAAVNCLDVIPYVDFENEFVFGQSFLWHLLQLNDICLQRNLDKYLVDRGMYVLPKFRRKGLACELLKCWSLVCKQFNIEVCIGTFTSKFSQVSARRAGLKELAHKSYDEMRKVFPTEIPLGIEEHSAGMTLCYASA